MRALNQQVPFEFGVLSRKPRNLRVSGARNRTFSLHITKEPKKLLFLPFRVSKLIRKSKYRPHGIFSKTSLNPLIWLLNFNYWTIDKPINKMIFVYVLIYMDFISELLFFIQNSVQISAVSHGHSGEV